MKKMIDTEISLYMDRLIRKQKINNAGFYQKQRELFLLYDQSLKSTTDKQLIKKLNTKA